MFVAETFNKIKNVAFRNSVFAVGIIFVCSVFVSFHVDSKLIDRMNYGSKYNGN